MKKYILILLAVCGTFAGQADERSDAILKRMADIFEGYGNYQVTFEADMPGEFQDVSGRYVVSGKKYYLEVYDNQVFFDGEDRYTYSAANDEIVVEKPDPSDRSILSDPTSIFLLYDEGYMHAVTATDSRGGRTEDVVTLSPRVGDTELERIEVRVDRSTGLPSGIVYTLRGYREDIRLSVTGVTPLATADTSLFRFDPSRYPDVEIIDFR